MKRLLSALALLVFCTGCASARSKADSFEWWTRYYEIRMNLTQETLILFEPPPDFGCAQVVMDWYLGRPITYYDPTAFFCRSPWDLARHEACHRRMQHHLMDREYVEQKQIDVEEEADECEGWY